MTKKELSTLIDLSNKEKSLKESLKEVQAEKADIEESIIKEMTETGKQEHRLGLFLIRLKAKEKFSLPESKSPLKGKLTELLKDLDLLEVCSNLYAPKVKKLIADKRLDEGIKKQIEPYTITETIHDLEIEIVPEME